MHNVHCKTFRRCELLHQEFSTAHRVHAQKAMAEGPVDLAENLVRSLEVAKETFGPCRFMHELGSTRRPPIERDRPD